MEGGLLNVSFSEGHHMTSTRFFGDQNVLLAPMFLQCDCYRLCNGIDRDHYGKARVLLGSQHR